MTTTIVCIQSDIFHQSFSLKVNKFILQYFRSLLCFAGPLSESEFLIDFSFSFLVIYLQVYCSIQTFKLVSYSLTSHFRGPGSQIPFENFGSRVPLDNIGVPGLGSHLWGPGFLFSVMPIKNESNMKPRVQYRAHAMLNIPELFAIRGRAYN